MNTFKTLCAGLSLSTMAALPAFALDAGETPMLNEGTQEISVAGRLEFPGFEDLNYDIDLSYGYFLKDGWEVGAQVGAADFAGTNRLDIGLFTEYNFLRHQWWVPYINAAIGVAAIDFDSDNFDASTNLDDEDGLIFDIETGIKWFVRPYMAISTAINFQFSPDDVFATDDEIEDNLTTIQVGMRFYF